MIGETLAHYEIVGKIGAGGMGEVYRAHDPRLDREVALKVLPSDTLADDNARARLVREARLASKLNHPNICTVHDVGEAQGQTYIAMELVEGDSLASLLERGALPVEQILLYGSQVSDALAHAHERGVVHRDLKSANIVITPEGRAKVLDFGLAKRIEGEALAEATTLSTDLLTSPGTIAGTLAYMAPEQLQGKPADERSDIWALGVVLYEMAAGKRPFHGQTGYELSGSILNKPLPPLPAATPPALASVIERCLAKEPGHRYQRASELRAALEAIREGQSLSWAGFRYTLKRRRLAAAAVVLVAVIAVVAAVVVLKPAWLGFTRGMMHVRSLAVLPLENLSGDPEQDSLAESIHDDLITNLAGLSSLKTVIARRTVMRFKGKDTPPQEIAQELHVNALITGALRRFGDSVRVTTQLIDPANGSQVWAHSYERDIRNVMSLENEIVAAIAREVNLPLTSEERSRLESVRTVNPEAYVAYTKGRFYLNKLTPEGLQKGLEYMQQAIDQDPTNPLPYAALALSYCRIGHGTNPPPDAFERAKAAALKAEELGGTLAETETALAEIRIFEEWDWAGGGRSLQHALALNPSLSDAQRMYSWYLVLVGRKDEGIAAMKRAIELDPLSPLFSSDLGWQCWSAGRYEEAMDAVQKALELNPDFDQALHLLGYLYLEKGMFKEAIEAHQKEAVVSPHWRWDLVRTYALAGRKDEARKMLAEMLEGEPKPNAAGLGGWLLPAVYAALGETDEAFGWMEAAVTEHNSFIPWMRANPNFASLRSDPRFQDLVSYMKLPELQ